MYSKYNVFISSTSSDLKECRNRARELLGSYGIDVTVQEEHHVTVDGKFEEIDRKVTSADLVICLVGRMYGQELPERDDEHIPKGLSWTQYEVWKAGDSGIKRMVFFHDPESIPDQSESDQGNQSEWRHRLEQELKTERTEAGEERTKDTFYGSFKSADELSNKLKHLMDEEPKFEGFRHRRWCQAIDRYRKSMADLWRKAWPNEFNGEADWAPQYPMAPTYIANQGLQELAPPADQMYRTHLRSAAFVVGRDTEAEATADTGDWHDVSLQQLQSRLVDLESSTSIRRLFVISGGGVGKSKLLDRIAFLINAEPLTATDSDAIGEPSFLACQLAASKLDSQADVIPLLASQLAAHEEFRKALFPIEEIERQLSIQYRQGRLVLLVDGLDHINVGKELPPSLRDLGASSWQQSPIVMSGRPYAVQQRFVDVGDSSSGHDQCIATTGWTFCRPREFNKSQQRVYLGKTSSGIDRFDLVPADAARILSVPRVAEYVRKLQDAELRKIESTADVYYRAIPELIRKTMDEAHLTRLIDPNALLVKLDGDADSHVVDRQVDYVVMMLAAAAFVMTKGDGEFPNFDHAQVKEKFLHQVYHRVKRFNRSSDDDDDIPYPVFQHHFKRCLAAINAVVSNGILDAELSELELQDLIWSNKSIQCFFAAYWLASYADRVSWKHNRTEYNYCDTDQFAEWIWYHESWYESQIEQLEGEEDSQIGQNDEYYEINRFLAEMPDEAKNTANWLNSIRAWFKPGAELRSAEMMYRTWPRLLRCAGEPVDDWWNVPYQSLFERRTSTDNLSAAKKRKPVSFHIDSQDRHLAREILTAFRGELQELIDRAPTAQNDARAQSAREFVDAANWKTVRGGNFQMGFPAELHEKQSKIDACWRNLLDRLTTLANAGVEQNQPYILGEIARKLSKEANKPIWFSGAQGKRFRKQDVEWLTGVLQPLEEAAHRQALLKRSGAGRDEIQSADEAVQTAYAAALAEMKAQWWACDHAPLENPQSVAPFEMHRFPILHKWFWIFAPGHSNSVQAYLDSKQQLGSERFRHPPEDHPVIYVSWIDAWAFCQWANWLCPETGIRYRCRLPHEPEWEFAARRTRSDDGTGDGGPIPFDQPYWWGREFYFHEFSTDRVPSGEPEPISNEYAHAIGTPAATRSPALSLPNGFGFHDILGNVWEWTASIYREPIQSENAPSGYSRHDPRQASSIPTNELRTMRGGLWYFLDLLARCSDRFRLHSDDRDYKMGFRVVRERV